MSPDAKTRSRNLRASPYAGKQARFGDKRLWWFVVLARGKVSFVTMDDGWQQTGEGIAAFVAMLADTLKAMLGNDAQLPRTICSDRGPGFYQASTGHIVGAYKEAAQAYGFRPYAGDDASAQPPDIPDVLPHETAVGWARTFFKKHPVRKGGGVADMERQFQAVLHDCAEYINANYDVAGLCRAFPARLAELARERGERLNH